jgi:hypothetical protein
MRKSGSSAQASKIAKKQGIVTFAEASGNLIRKYLGARNN